MANTMSRSPTIRRLAMGLAALALSTMAARAGSLATGPEADYLIVTPAAWTSALNSYVSVKTSQGFSPRLFNVEDIYAAYDGADNPERIRNFITDCYTNWSDVGYVLLVGFTNSVPTRMSDGENDVYYSLLDGTGYNTRVIVGRMPAVDTTEVARIAAGWANYNSRGWGRSQVCLTGEEDQMFGATNTLGNYGWSTIAMHGSNIFVTLTTNDVMENLNLANGLITWVGHGNEGQWFMNTGEPPEDPDYFGYTHRDVMNRTQTNLPFINAMLSCNAGHFLADTQYIAACFIRAPNAGAIGYIGANRIVYREQDFVKGRFESRMLDSYRRTGFAHPARFFYESISGSGTLCNMFNLLGDPTVEMDLRPSWDDNQSPYVNTIQLSATQIVAGTIVSNVTLVHDDDQVGVVEELLVLPDGSVTTNELPYVYSAGSYQRDIGGYDTVQTGVYQVLARAWDISGNSVIDTGPIFVVTADLVPPEIGATSISPTQAYEGVRVDFELSASDETRLAYRQAVIVNPDSVTNILDMDGVTFFTDTFTPGLYTVAFIAADYAGNTAQSNATFTILDDSEPPVIAHAWVAEDPPMGEGDITRSFYSESAPCTPDVMVAASDNVTDDMEMEAMLFIEHPNGSVTTNEAPSYGIWPGSYNAIAELPLMGTYAFRFRVRDVALNETWSERFFYHVVPMGRPTPTIVEHEITATQALFSILGIPAGASLLACTNLDAETDWQPVSPDETLYTNGLFRFRIAIPTNLPRQYYKGSTNDP